MGHCPRCGAEQRWNDLCPACRRLEEQNANAQRLHDSEMKAMQQAEEAEQQRHADQMAAAAADLAMRERELQLNRTENCLVCGTPVNTGRGSGLWLNEEEFPGGELPDVLSSVRELLAWTRNPGKGIHDKIWASMKDEAAPFGDPGFAVADWTGFEERAKAFLADREASAESQEAIGPYCCKKCADEAFATDPAVRKAQEDRARIASEWERLSGDPVFAAARSAADGLPARKEAFERLRKKHADAYWASPEGQAERAEQEARRQALLEARAAEAAERRRKGLEEQTPKQRKAFLVCLAVPFAWFVLTWFSKDSFWNSAALSFLVFAILFAKAAINRFSKKKDNGHYASKWCAYGYACFALALVMLPDEAKQKRECHERQRLLQGQVAVGKDGVERPLDGAKCPGGRRYRMSVIPSTWNLHAWDARVPVLYDIECSKHGSARGCNEQPGHSDIYCHQIDDNVRIIVDYAEHNAIDLPPEKGAELRALFRKERVLSLLKSELVPDEKTKNGWSVDPYTGQVSVETRVSIDPESYKAFAAEVVRVLSPLAVEKETCRAKLRDNYGSGELYFDTPSQGKPLYVVRDPETLETDVLLFSDAAWKGVEMALLRNEFHVEVSLENGRKDTEPRSKPKTFSAITGFHATDRNYVLPFLSADDIGGLRGVVRDKTFATVFDKDRAGAVKRAESAVVANQAAPLDKRPPEWTAGH